MKKRDPRRPKMLPVTLALAALLALGGTVDAAMEAASGWLAADSGAGRSETYRAGQRALDAKEWDEAAALFRQIADAGEGEADAALYWNAYALIRAGRKGEAVSALAQLESRYPDSPWIDDAGALELEASGADNPRVRAQAAEDEELKLYALNSLMHVESEKAIPVLAEFLRDESSPELKRKALFVLSQSDSPQAREILVGVARGRQHPELALEAVEMLGFYDDSEGRRQLQEIYTGTEDKRVKRKVVEALMIAEGGDELFAIAREEADSELRGKAVEMLGVMEATEQLGELYASETDVEVKVRILEAFFIADDADTLLAAATSEAEPELRRKAIEGLGLIGDSRAREALRSLYDSSTDSRDREQIIEAFFLADDADTLLEILEGESDSDLRRKAIESLGLIGDARAGEALRGLYPKATDGGEREKILEAFFLADDTDSLLEVLDAETDPGLRRKAIQSLALVGDPRAAQALSGLYRTAEDPEEKEKILEAFFLQNNHRDLIEVVRTEEDRDLKRKALEYLSLIDSDEATEYVLGLLED